jgi:hypothetical protein
VKRDENEDNQVNELAQAQLQADQNVGLVAAATVPGNNPVPAVAEEAKESNQNVGLVAAAKVSGNNPVPAVDKPVVKDADVIVKTIPKTKVIGKYFSKTYSIPNRYNI